MEEEGEEEGEEEEKQEEDSLKVQQFLQKIKVYSHTEQWFATCGLRPPWSRMTLSEGSPKTIGKHRYLHYDL